MILRPATAGQAVQAAPTNSSAPRILNAQSLRGWTRTYEARYSRGLTFLNYRLRRFCSSENHPHTGENETRADK